MAAENDKIKSFLLTRIKKSGIRPLFIEIILRIHKYYLHLHMIPIAKTKPLAQAIALCHTMTNKMAKLKGKVWLLPLSQLHIYSVRVRTKNGYHVIQKQRLHDACSRHVETSQTSDRVMDKASAIRWDVFIAHPLCIISVCGYIRRGIIL